MMRQIVPSFVRQAIGPVCKFITIFFILISQNYNILSIYWLASVYKGISKSINNYEEELYEIYENAGNRKRLCICELF